MCFLLMILVFLTIGIGADSESTNCIDSMNRPGTCVPVSGCPFLIEEFYEQVRTFPNGIDFESFISQILCGFDGFRFLICCTIRSNTNEQQQASLTDPWYPYNQPSSALFHFAPLGPKIEPSATPEPILMSIPVPSQQSVPTTNNSPPQDLIVIIPTAGDTSSPLTSEPSLTSIKSISDMQGGECGITNVFTNRVVGGTDARKGAYPWMAALGYNEPAQPTVLKFLCSGSLVSRTYVITAAHCAIPSLTIVRLGAHDLSIMEASVVDVKIKRQIIHEKFDLKTISNDIALLQLTDPISFTEYISPICLPEDIKFMQQDFVGYNPFIAGWGTVQFQGATSNVLRDAQVPVIDTLSCLTNYSTMFKAVESPETLLCAGSYITDACQGDSGGPLMMPQLEDAIFRYYIIGLVSYGYECARAGFPGVYTRVAVYMQWIKSNMI